MHVSRSVLPEDLETIEKIYPTKRKEKSTMTKKVHAKKTRKKKKNKGCEDTVDSVSEEAFNSSFSFTANWRQIAQPSSSSESEYSDSESGVNEHIKYVNAYLTPIFCHTASKELSKANKITLRQNTRECRFKMINAF